MLRLFLLFFISITIISCGSKPELSKAEEDSAQVLFDRANIALEQGLYKEAANVFDEIERQYPYSEYATNAQFLAGMAHYESQDYDGAIIAFERFIELHPSNENIPQAYFTKALCYYEQISDTSRDQKKTQIAKESMQEVFLRFPNTRYANEAKLKYDLTVDHLAGKEMNIGRYYLNRNEYIAAMNRFMSVVDNYQTSSHTPEALYRLVEMYLSLKLSDQAYKTLAVLGYNYPESSWYKKGYNLGLAQGIGTK